MSDYTIIHTTSVAELEDRVNRYKSIGWQCVGGPFAMRPSISGPIVFYQAVDKVGPRPYQRGWQLSTNQNHEGSRKKWGRPKKDDNGQTP